MPFRVQNELRKFEEEVLYHLLFVDVVRPDAPWALRDDKRKRDPSGNRSARDAFPAPREPAEGKGRRGIGPQSVIEGTVRPGVVVGGGHEGDTESMAS